ncbi:MAG TPA: hypothetical protein VGD63_09255 [Steroidobacteraceae bacterium]
MLAIAAGLGCAAAGAASVETLLEAPGPTGPLRGTLLAPAEYQGAVVLIIPGSGPTDRDGNSPAGLSAGSYRLLAEGLAARGAFIQAGSSRISNQRLLV